MDFFTVVQKRRSIRRFKPDSIPESVILKSLEAATLAPNSSNAQTWNFYWVHTESKKKALIKYCFNQSAARTAAELIVAVASPSDWKRSQPELIKWVHQVNAPKQVIQYYEKFFPFMYKWGFFNIFGLAKKIAVMIIGIFRPIMRYPHLRSEVQEVCIKSTALACENFVLAMTAQGYDTCMMEGFDEYRVKKLLSLKCNERVAMVIAAGKEGDNSTWGPQYRLPLEKVIHRV